jgi:hypothetical protein
MSPSFSISALNLKPVKNYVFVYAFYIRWSDKCLLMSSFSKRLTHKYSQISLTKQY